MPAKIDTNYEALRVVENQPVSYGWSDHITPTLAMLAKPPITKLALLVYNMAKWTTQNMILADRILSLRAGS